MTADSFALNKTRFEEVTGGDKELAQELAELYLNTAETYITEMIRILGRDGDWSGPAHALKGASANLGVAKMHELAKKAEFSDPSDNLMQELQAGLVEARHVFDAHNC